MLSYFLLMNGYDILHTYMYIYGNECIVYIKFYYKPLANFNNELSLDPLMTGNCPFAE